MAQDLYIKTSDPTGRRAPIISHHRVWDRDLFLRSQLEIYSKKAGTPDHRVVSPCTETEYRQFMNYRVI